MASNCGKGVDGKVRLPDIAPMVNDASKRSGDCRVPCIWNTRPTPIALKKEADDDTQCRRRPPFYAPRCHPPRTLGL